MSFDEALAAVTTYFSKKGDDPDAVRIYLDEVLPCFETENNELGYHDVTIYVEQPVANSDEINVGWNAGHTFVQITQGINGKTVTQVIGFYPDEDDVSPNKPKVLGDFFDDSGHEYDVSLQVELNSNQFNNIIEYLNSLSLELSVEYDLNNFNCSDFGLEIMSMTGIQIPDTQGVWGGELNYDLGEGTCPALLGQDIRNTDFGNNVIKDTNGGNAYNSTENDCFE